MEKSPKNPALSKDVMETVKLYEEHYSPVGSYLLDGEQKYYIGDKHSVYCRFCGKRAPDVTFRKVAHAFPESIGNKCLISYEECDECNDLFARTVDDHFGRYSLLARCASGVVGKRGVPSIKCSDGVSRVDWKEGRMCIMDGGYEGFVRIDEEKKTICITGSRQSYVPRLVYKCFVKMALSIMPSGDLGFFQRALDWLQLKDYRDDLWNTDYFFQVKCAFTPGPHPYRRIWTTLFCRKNPNVYLPHYLFFVAFGNYCYQLVLPFSEEDAHLMEKKVSLPAFKSPLHCVNPFGEIRYWTENLSSNEVVAGKEETVNFSFAYLEPNAES